jgi:hypothetical protein
VFVRLQRDLRVARVIFVLGLDSDDGARCEQLFLRNQAHARRRETLANRCVVVTEADELPIRGFEQHPGFGEAMRMPAAEQPDFETTLDIFLGSTGMRRAAANCS